MIYNIFLTIQTFSIEFNPINFLLDGRFEFDDKNENCCRITGL